jgi:hypothetical protein
MDIDEIKNKLVDSCSDLNSQYDILNNIQYKQCREELNSQKFSREDKEDTEYKIFGENRDTKLSFYYNLLRNVKYQLYTDYKNENYYKNLNLIKRLQKISNKFDTKLINKYKNKEHSHYDLLLDNYNKIDRNRRNNLDILEDVNTKNQQLIIENNKFSSSEYTITLTIFIIMLLIFLLLIILFLKI